MKKQLAAFNAGRIGNTARSLAVSLYAVERVREHATTSWQFGKALCEFQGPQWVFAGGSFEMMKNRLCSTAASPSARLARCRRRTPDAMTGPTSTLLDPHSVALVGASDDLSKTAFRPLR